MKTAKTSTVILPTVAIPVPTGIHKSLAAMRRLKSWWTQPNVLLGQSKRRFFAARHRQTYRLASGEGSTTTANAKAGGIVTKQMLAASQQAVDLVINRPAVLLEIRQIPGPSASGQQDVKAMTLVHLANLTLWSDLAMVGEASGRARLGKITTIVVRMQYRMRLPTATGMATKSHFPIQNFVPIHARLEPFVSRRKQPKQSLIRSQLILRLLLW